MREYNVVLGFYLVSREMETNRAVVEFIRNQINSGIIFHFKSLFNSNSDTNNIENMPRCQNSGENVYPLRIQGENQSLPT
jgi:hypothetical protein